MKQARDKTSPLARVENQPRETVALVSLAFCVHEVHRARSGGWVSIWTWTYAYLSVSLPQPRGQRGCALTGRKRVHHLGLEVESASLPWRYAITGTNYHESDTNDTKFFGGRMGPLTAHLILNCHGVMADR